MPTSSCNCKVEHVCAALTTTTTHTVHHYHHYHHYVEREEGHETASPRAAKVFVNHLTPPITTAFFHKETIPIFDNLKIQDGASQLLETVTWRTEVYKYVTRVRPDDPDFKKNGGEIFIIMVHTGTSQMGRPSILPEYLKTVKVPSSIIPMRQYPATSSGIQSGDDWAYNIDYTNAMPMFSNGGNNVFDFEASYKEDFVRSKFQQTGAEVTGGVEFAAVYPRAINLNYPIMGLSVFKCLDPKVFPVDITFEAAVNDSGMVRGSASKKVKLAFDLPLPPSKK